MKETINSRSSKKLNTSCPPLHLIFHLSVDGWMEHVIHCFCLCMNGAERRDDWVTERTTVFDCNIRHTHSVCGSVAPTVPSATSLLVY